MANRKVLLSIFVNIVFKLLQIQFESWQHVLNMDSVNHRRRLASRRRVRKLRNCSADVTT